MQKKWKYISENSKNSKNYDEIKKLTKNDLLTQLLINRGIDTTKKVREYLEPLKMEFTSPYDFTDMQTAVERILSAVENNEFILIHGDFDADGVTSTALLSKILTLLKANFDIYIPNRETESHGLSTKVILPLKAKKRLKLVITCDCATSNIQEIKMMKSFGIDTIVTDHHEPSEELPDAVAIINPKVEGKLKEDLDADKIKHLSDLAGVGVAFKLALGILEKIGQQSFAENLLPLVAVGTIADVVPLLGENRAFVLMGLNAIKEGKNEGILKLLKMADIDVSKGVKAENIAFQIAPRLNATGRMEKADDAYKLLTVEGDKQTEFLCHELNSKNMLRQTYCEKIYKEAVEMYENSEDTEEYAIVLYKEDWHMGVIGIVAAKLADKYNKPVLLMCKDADETVIRSSARSIQGINIFEMLNEMNEYFIKFGGHKGAAGLSFDSQKYSFTQIKKLIFENAKKYSQDIDLTPILKVDLKVSLEDLNKEFVESLSVLEPCGACNSYPVLSIENLQLREQKLIGQKQNHLKFVCADSKNNTVDCVYWNHNVFELKKDSHMDIAFYPKINDFNNNITLQLDIQDAHYEIQNDIKIYDHRKKQDILPLVCDFVTKNAQKVYIYITNKKLKNSLIDIGFPLNSFVPKPDISHLMFFDYPDSKNSMKKIIEKYSPENLHFMRCENDKMPLEEFFNKFLGMVKYASNNKNGEFDSKIVADNLNTTSDIIQLTTEILVDCGAIKIKKVIYEPDTIFNLEYLTSIPFEKIKNSEKFEELEMKISKLTEFKEQILASNEEELEKILL